MKTLLAASIATILVLASCSRKEVTPVEYFPFKTETTDFWGMMGLDGNILFDGRFMYCPSVSSRGLFMAREENGLLSFYTAEANPRKIGKDYYTSAKLFLYSDYTPVRKKDEYNITIINKKGEEVAKLPQQIIDVGFFAEGLAPFRSDDIRPRMGYIDEKGNVKIEPQYIVATNFLCGVALVAYEKNDEMTISIIGSNGKTVYTFGQGIRPLSWEYSDGLLAVIDTVGKIGFIDTRGKIAIKPAEELKLCQPRNPANIPYTFKNGRCIYYDGEHYGLLDRNGNIAVPAQYKTIYLGEGGLFAVENTRNEWGCIDGDGNTVLPFEYVTGEIRPSIDAHAIVVQNESGRYKIVNEQGKTISHLTFSQYQSKYYNL